MKQASMQPTVSTYWCPLANFGDRLTHALLDHFGLHATFTAPAAAELVGVGSILQEIPETFGGLILGTGFMWAHNRRAFPSARILAVRGALTLARLSGNTNAVLGDSGVLASLLVPSRPEITHRLGLIPHYVDKKAFDVLRLVRQHPDEILLIDVERAPHEVIYDVARCQAVVSSSLHGLIVAESLGIPTRWCQSELVLGHGFKFRDYYSAFGEQRSPIALDGRQTLHSLLAAVERPPRDVPMVAAALSDLFRELPWQLARCKLRRAA